MVVSSAACPFTGVQGEQDWGTNAFLGGISADGQGFGQGPVHPDLLGVVGQK